MRLRWKFVSPSSTLVLAAALGLVTTPACRKEQPHETELKVPPAGEPDRYSATVIRTVDDGTQRNVSTIREFRSGEMRREEWSEQGHNRALIWRPDLGTAFLLDLDARTYVEIKSDAQERDSLPGSQAIAGSNQLEAMEKAFADAPSPEHIETRALPDELIEGHPCSVYEQRTTFADGHTEMTKTFRARNLGGLALRIEAGPEPGTVKVITERRDVRTDVADDAFVVPADYKKSEKPIL